MVILGLFSYVSIAHAQETESVTAEGYINEEQIEQIGAEANETERESTFDEDTIPEKEHNVLIEGKVDGAWHELDRKSTRLNSSH